MAIKIQVAKPEQIEGLWPLVYPLLAPAFDEALLLTPEATKEMLQRDKTLLFMAVQGNTIMGAAVAEIDEGCNRIVNVLVLGGKDFKAWGAQMNDALTKYARFMECRYIVALARKGWSRLWPDFTMHRHLFLKEVYNG